MVHDKEIEIRWRDLDAFGHVNNAVYLNYIEEVRDEWLARVLADDASIWDFVLAGVQIAFRRELVQGDDRIVTRCRLVRVGRSSVTTREDVVTRNGVLVAEAKSVLVARAPDKAGSRPLSRGERDAFEGALEPADEGSLTS